MDLSENELSEIIIGLCIEVHRELGPGLLESVYEEALAYELGITGLKFTRQENLPVYYKSIKLNIGFRTDIVVENKVLVEIKSVETTSAMHKKIVLNYIKLRDLKLALLVNFNVMLLKNGIVRLVNGLEEQ